MYLLDTNILSELMRRQPNPQVEARFAAEPGELFASAGTVEEIRYGARIGPPGNRLWERAEADLFPHLTVLALDQPVAVLAADLRAEWKRSGTPVVYSDGLIAATAKHFGLTLVTRSVRHFGHVPGLSVQNWFE